MSTQQGGFWHGVGVVLKFLVRLLFVLLVGSLVGAAVYFGIPWVYKNLVEPVQRNTYNLAVLQQSWELERERLGTEIADLSERVTRLEVAVADWQQVEATRQAEVQAVADELDAVKAEVAQVQADLTASEQAQATAVATLEAEVAAVQAQIDAAPWEEAIAAKQQSLATQIETLAGQLAALEEAMKKTGAQVATSLADTASEQQWLAGQVAALQVAQDLLKVRLLLLEENTRAAKETLELTLAHLKRADALMPAQAETWRSVYERVEALPALIDQKSFRVGLELEALWAEVMDVVLASSPPPMTEIPSSPVPTPTLPASSTP